MTRSSLLQNLEKKRTRAESIARKVIEDPKLLPALLDGFHSTVARVRFKSAKTLALISQQKPSLLYPHFDFFAENLYNKNNILKWNAIDTIAHLTAVDSEKRFDRLFSKFYKMLEEGSLITAAHAIAGSPLIAKAKPYLERRITQRVLRLDEIPMPTEECRNILKGHAIRTFDQYFDQIEHKNRVLNFVKRELNNGRAATRRKAERFLKKWVG